MYAIRSYYVLKSGVIMRRGKVVIERERCKGCYLCVAHCPFGVLAADTAMNGAGVYPSTVKNPEKS